MRPRVAIVHDYLTQRGGAERVVLSMLAAFPDAAVYTALYDLDATYPEFGRHRVLPIWTNRSRSLRSDHRRGLAAYPFAFATTRIDADVVVCSSSGFAHGVRTTGRKVVYCYTPARWLYDQAPGYLAGWPGPVQAGLRLAAPALRAWDRRAAATADQYIVTSNVVRERVHDAYGIRAAVVPPPVSVDVTRSQAAVAGVQPGFVLCVSRLLSYKNVDAVVGAFDLLPNARLLVVGDGPERARLEALAGPNTTMLGQVTDGELAWLYANCAGLVAASREDFGLTPVEAGAYGKPSAVLRYGGFLDTVLEGETGLFFDEPKADSVAVAVAKMLGASWVAGRIADHFDAWSHEAFTSRLEELVLGPLRAPLVDKPAIAAAA